jgi:5-methylcytosine-specific restriction endonuclease McrA
MDNKPLSNQDFYQSQSWHKARAVALKRARLVNAPCGICGGVLDYKAKRGVLIDHKIARKKRPDLSFDQDNLQPVHHRCNSRKRDWVDNSDIKPTNFNGFPPGWE